jgi:HEAT repeat protein
MEALFPTGTAADRILDSLLLVTGVLLAATTGFALLTVALRFRHMKAMALSSELEQRWKPLLLGALADPAETRALAGTVGPGEELYFVDQVWEIARRVRGVEREMLTRIGRPYLGVLIQRTRDRDPEVRARAVQTMGVMGMPEHADLLLAALDDRSVHVSMTAARALARKEHPQYAPAVLARLDRFQTWNQRYLAAMLAGIGLDASKYLRRILADGTKSEWSRTVAASSLALLRDLEGGDLAADILEKGASGELASACATLLGATARPDHLPILRRLSSATDYVVRMIALEALAALGDAGDLSRLEAALHDPSPWVALRAGYALKELGGTEALARLAASTDERAVLAREVLGTSAA